MSSTPEVKIPDKKDVPKKSVKKRKEKYNWELRVEQLKKEIEKESDPVKIEDLKSKIAKLESEEPKSNYEKIQDMKFDAKSKALEKLSEEELQKELANKNAPIAKQDVSLEDIQPPTRREMQKVKTKHRTSKRNRPSNT